MHMYINFNTLLEADSLMISFFLMDLCGPPSICSLEAMGEEGEYEACRSTRRLYLILIERWQLGVAMQLRSVASNRMCSQTNPLRFADICCHRHSLNPCMDQNLEEDCWQAFQWTPFPKSELYLRWIPISFPPASRSRNRPLYLHVLLSGFARGQALGCHAVARADRMQKTHWKVCRNTPEITENDWSVVLNRRRLTVSTFSPNHWSWRCHLLAPRWAEIDRLASGAERAREIKAKKQLAIADAGAAAAAAQSEGETSSRRACGSRKADRGTQETWGRNGASTCLLECENASSKVALSHTLFWERERKRRLAEAFISGLSVVQWKALWKALGIELKEKILSQSVLLTRKEAGRTWEVLVGWQWWPLKTICSWWPVWGSGSGGCSRSWHTFLVCRRLVCHLPFKKWISFLYLRLGRLPPLPSWEDVKASRVLPCKLPWHIYCLGCHRVVHRNS